MTTNDIDPNPEATSYFTRLDVSPDVNKRGVRSAWKVASSEYHPDNSGSRATQENYIRLQKARDVLKDPNKRKIYRMMCDKCGKVDGTELYEDWVSQGKPTPVSDWVEAHENVTLDGESADSPSKSSDASWTRTRTANNTALFSINRNTNFAGGSLTSQRWTKSLHRSFSHHENDVSSISVSSASARR